MSRQRPALLLAATLLLLVLAGVLALNRLGGFDAFSLSPEDGS